MKTIILSEDGVWYYVGELSCANCNWLSIQIFTEEPKFKDPLSYPVQYDNRYYRIVKPFKFWKFKESESRQVKDDNELVKDYLNCGHEDN